MRGPREPRIRQLSINRAERHKCQANGLSAAEARASADLPGLRSPPLHSSALISRMFRKLDSKTMRADISSAPSTWRQLERMDPLSA